MIGFASLWLIERYAMEGGRESNDWLNLVPTSNSCKWGGRWLSGWLKEAPKFKDRRDWGKWLSEQSKLPSS